MCVYVGGMVSKERGYIKTTTKCNCNSKSHYLQILLFACACSVSCRICESANSLSFQCLMTTGMRFSCNSEGHKVGVFFKFQLEVHIIFCNQEKEARRVGA